MMRLKRPLLLKAQKTRAIYKKVCSTLDLVYFGHVSQYSDEHEMVRGFTLSPSHIDNHYCVGTVAGRDMILLERTDRLSFPDRSSRSYTWTILQIDLHTHSSPHIVLNPNRYEGILYSHLFAKFRDLAEYPVSYFTGHDEKFTSRFHVYGSQQRIEVTLQLLSPGTTSVLGHHFSNFDYECQGDRLILYYPTIQPTTGIIEDMVRAGVWLAGEIDATAQLSS